MIPISMEFPREPKQVVGKDTLIVAGETNIAEVRVDLFKNREIVLRW